MVYLYVATMNGPRSLAVGGGELATPDAFAGYGEEENIGVMTGDYKRTAMPGHDIMSVAAIARAIRGPGAV